MGGGKARKDTDCAYFACPIVEGGQDRSFGGCGGGHSIDNRSEDVLERVKSLLSSFVFACLLL